MYDIEQLRKSAEYFLIYLRKSRQDNESETVEEVLSRHETRLQEFAVRLTGHTVPEENIYREVVSGETIKDRPEIKNVLKRMEDPNCIGVLVVDPQRLTRGDLIDCGTIMQAFQYTETKVHTPERTYDLSSEFDRDYFERELLRGKDYVAYAKKVMMKGRETSVREGKWISSIPPFGYDRYKLDTKGWSLAINEKEAELVRLMFHLYVNEGMGAMAISHKINELGGKPRKSERFSPTAIRQILSNEVYIGKVTWQSKPVVKVFEDGKVIKKRVRKKDYELIDGLHKPIISEELFYAAQERKGNATKEKADTELKNIYAGLIKCKKCGGAIAMRIHRYKGVVTRADRYYCRTGRYCVNKSTNVEEVQKMILKSLKEYLEDFKVKISGDNKNNVLLHQNIIKNLEDELDKLEKRQVELYDFLESGLYTKEVFLMRNEKLAEDRESLKEQIKKARQDMPSIEIYEQQYYSLFQAVNSIEDPHINAKTKNLLLKKIIDVIYYEKDEADIPHKSRGEIKLEIKLK